jgi:hypothetical protein
MMHNDKYVDQKAAVKELNSKLEQQMRDVKKQYVDDI